MTEGPTLVQIGIVLSAYVILVLTTGVLASRRSASSPEEFFLAGRGLGTFVLFMALFGTNATAFVLVGIPGLAYREGVGVFGLNAAIVALGTPLTFILIGAPACRAARILGAMTPAELYAKRFGSKGLGYLLFFFFAIYTLPYMVTAVKGAAVTLESMTKGAVPEWMGGFAVLAVAFVYTLLGGMRATAWTNVVQGTLFLVFMVVAFFAIPLSLGGFSPAMEAVRETRPEVLELSSTGRFAPRAWASWGMVISLTVIAFPHMLVRMFAAKGQASLRSVVRLYPPALILLWFPAVMIGVWGIGAFPELGAAESDQVFSRMVSSHLSPWLAAVGFLAVLAAVMSTLDAQLLTLSSMLVRDVLTGVRKEASPRGDVRAARGFVLAVAGLVYGLALVWGSSIFRYRFPRFFGLHHFDADPLLLAPLASFQCRGSDGVDFGRECRPLSRPFRCSADVWVSPRFLGFGVWSVGRGGGELPHTSPRSEFDPARLCRKGGRVLMNEVDRDRDEGLPRVGLSLAGKVGFSLFFLGVTGALTVPGLWFANRERPLIFGMPFLLFWVVLWVVISFAGQLCLYLVDQANREGSEEGRQR